MGCSDSKAKDDRPPPPLYVREVKPYSIALANAVARDNLEEVKRLIADEGASPYGMLGCEPVVQTSDKNPPTQEQQQQQQQVQQGQQTETPQQEGQPGSEEEEESNQKQDISKARPGMSMIHIAAANNAPKVLAFLLAESRPGNQRRELAPFKIDPNQIDQVSPSTSDEDDDHLLLQHGLAPIHYAARNGASKAARVLVRDFKVDPNLQAGGGSGGPTPLHFAAHSDKKQIIKVLNEFGANPNGVGGTKATPPVFSAVRGNSLVALRTLVEDCKASLPSTTSVTVMRQRDDGSSQILNKDAEQELQTEGQEEERSHNQHQTGPKSDQQDTPEEIQEEMNLLQFAIHRKAHPSIIEYLSNPIDSAFMVDDHEWFKVLIARHQSPTSSSPTQDNNADKSSKLHAPLEQFLQGKTNLRLDQQTLGMELLHHAAAVGAVKCCQLLCEQYARNPSLVSDPRIREELDKNETERGGHVHHHTFSAPIHHAASIESYELQPRSAAVVQLLTSTPTLNVDPNLEDEHGSPAMHYAAFANNLEVVKILLSLKKKERVLTNQEGQEQPMEQQPAPEQRKEDASATNNPQPPLQGEEREQFIEVPAVDPNFGGSAQQAPIVSAIQGNAKSVVQYLVETAGVDDFAPYPSYHEHEWVEGQEPTMYSLLDLAIHYEAWDCAHYLRCRKVEAQDKREAELEAQQQREGDDASSIPKYIPPVPPLHAPTLKTLLEGIAEKDDVDQAKKLTGLGEYLGEPLSPSQFAEYHYGEEVQVEKQIEVDEEVPPTYAKCIFGDGYFAPFVVPIGLLDAAVSPPESSLTGQWVIVGNPGGNRDGHVANINMLTLDVPPVQPQGEIIRLATAQEVEAAKRGAQQGQPQQQQQQQQQPADGSTSYVAPEKQTRKVKRNILETQFGQSLVHFLVEKNAILCLRHFLSQQLLDPEQPDNSDAKSFPLHHAALSNHVEAAKILIEEFDADPNKEDLHGNTPLYFAAYNDASEFVKDMVLDLGADPEFGGSEDIPPLFAAAMGDALTTARILVEDCGCSVEATIRGRSSVSTEEEGVAVALEQYCEEHDSQQMLAYVRECKEAIASEKEHRLAARRQQREDEQRQRDLAQEEPSKTEPEGAESTEQAQGADSDRKAGEGEPTHSSDPSATEESAAPGNGGSATTGTEQTAQQEDNDVAVDDQHVAASDEQLQEKEKENEERSEEVNQHEPPVETGGREPTDTSEPNSKQPSAVANTGKEGGDEEVSHVEGQKDEESHPSSKAADQEAHDSTQAQESAPREKVPQKPVEAAGEEQQEQKQAEQEEGEEEEEWILDEESGYLYGQTSGFFYDQDSNLYYDPEAEVWMEEDGTVVPDE